MEYAACAWRAGRGVCRCCLSEGCYKDIATEYYWMGERELYQDMLRECFDLTISYQDGGTNSNSRLICEVCITRLRDASNFKKQVINAEKRFAEHILTGSKLSDITEAAPAATFQEVKLEGVKDETGISDDDDMGADEAATDDPDYDPDYDESDMLPLKFEVQKKEALVEFSFGDEMPTLNTNETTIRRVSKSKGKSPSKKIKMSKKELTIKPIKASGSKVAKVPKAPKPAKVPVKKGPRVKAKKVTERRVRELKTNVSARTLRRRRRANNEFPEESEKRIAKTMMRRNAMTIVEFSTAWPFRWWRNAFFCSYCDGKFVDAGPLRDHVNSLHLHEVPTKKIFSKITENNMIKIDIAFLACQLCGQSIHDIEGLKTHLVEVHNKIIHTDYSDGVLTFKLNAASFECQKCSEDFINFSKLNEHLNTHYQNYICDTCGKAFVSKSRFRTHVQSHEIGHFPCHECGEDFSTRAARMCHKFRVHKKGVRYTCPRCPELFTTYYNRSRHLVNAHNERTTDYPCKICGRVFEASCKRAVHVRSAHLPPERKHPCNACDWRFATKSQLRKHMLTHAKQAETPQVDQITQCHSNTGHMQPTKEDIYPA